jgi:hypothetical protein
MFTSHKKKNFIPCFGEKKLDSQHLLMHNANYKNQSLLEIYLFLYTRLAQYFYKIGISDLRYVIRPKHVVHSALNNPVNTEL